MKFGEDQSNLDGVDLRILAELQEHCKVPLAKIGERVGLSAPAVIERIKKLEDSGVIRGYTATLDGRKLGLDITAFIGVSMAQASRIGEFDRHIRDVPAVLECHHVTGEYTFLLKVKTASTSTLEDLLARIRSVDGVGRTETMVVLSTGAERSKLPIPLDPHPGGKRSRRGDRAAAA